MLRLLKIFAVWCLVAFPFSPSLYALAVGGPDCFRDNAPATPIACLGMITALAPIAAILGPIPADQENPPSVLPRLLLTSLIAAAFMTALHAFGRVQSTAGTSI